MSLTWMAWTWPTAAFFVFILCAISAMGVWEYFSPGGNPRRGLFGLDTTRGDRLFISLLGIAFILIGWIALVGVPIWGGVAVGAVWALFVFWQV